MRWCSLTEAELHRFTTLTTGLSGLKETIDHVAGIRMQGCRRLPGGLEAGVPVMGGGPGRRRSQGGVEWTTEK